MEEANGVKMWLFCCAVISLRNGKYLFFLFHFEMDFSVHFLSTRCKTIASKSFHRSLKVDYHPLVSCLVALALLFGNGRR